MVGVDIVGVGWFGFSPNVHDHSFREMMFEAATRAFQDAGAMNPREQVDAFISCQEDFWEGISISDEFAPDPIGGSMRPTMTVAGDGIEGLAHGVMLIKTGIADVVVVESHAKPSDILTFNKIVELAMDPIYLRGRKVVNYHFIAALDAVKYMRRTGISREDLASVVIKNKGNGLKTSRAPFSSRLSKEDVMSQEVIVYPFTDVDIARPVDAGIVVILASDSFSRKFNDTPIAIKGIGYATDSSNFELAALGEANYMRVASSIAYDMANIESPLKVSGIFVDDRYSYKELEHLEALGINEVAEKLKEGYFHQGSYLPVNPFGGHLAKGYPLEAAGLSLVLDAVEYLREGAESAIVGSWRGIPTFTGGTVVLSR
ncbi:thiolase domain-containing protein [Metallosphaera cuprina]|uniref:Acetoacetyl-CoA beta-ketothiolase n=1 Tax=Metallosphaera cuprina (strain Ar-4) TaxID=1006006 RepID=F4G0U1_METCR|nr:thiolase domain-containing protein [Metallosphaera cuprina]AEB95900.1 acetoacetyl-CoA beta-ketothiolase [Metallosphaera cuprina Ar-4]